MPVWWDSFHHNVEGKIRTKRNFFLQRTSFAVHMQPPRGGSAESSPYGYQNTNRQCFSIISGHVWGFFFFKLWIDLYKCKDLMRYNHFICLKQSFKERNENHTAVWFQWSIQFSKSKSCLLGLLHCLLFYTFSLLTVMRNLIT